MRNETLRFFNYVEVDIEVVQKIFSNYDSEMIVDEFKLIPEGQSTSNYIVYVNHYREKYLLKIYPEVDDKCRREYSSYMYAKTKTNTPNIITIDDSNLIINKPYMIIEYIDSVSLKYYILSNKQFEESIAYEVGCNLGKLHNQHYDKKALFNKDLSLGQVLEPSVKVFDRLLNGYAGDHINSTLKENILNFINKNHELFQFLEPVFVFTHGDFYSPNILIDNNKKIWFIDYEYTLSTSIYHDIGKFFRYNEMLHKYRTKEVYDSFHKGYNQYAIYKLPANWIKLALLYDLTGMLSLINKEQVTQQWLSRTETALIQTLYSLEK